MENIIIDTDLGFDCDDGGAIAIANMLHNKKLVNLLAITHSVNRQIGGSAIKAINEFYGNKNIPVGIADFYAINVDNFYNEFYAKFHYKESFAGWTEKPTFYKLFNGLKLENYCNFYSSCKVITNELSKVNDKSVTFVCIGQLNNLASILSDKFSKEIFEKKVKKVVIMCGNFLQDSEEFLLGDLFWKGEFNVIIDIKSSKFVFENLRLPTYVLDFNQGCDVFSGEPFSLQKHNPVCTMYKNHGNGINFNLPSWDLLTVMFASGCFENIFLTSNCGKILIDDNGRSQFINIKGNDFLIKLNKNPDEVSVLINNFILNYKI